MTSFALRGGGVKASDRSVVVACLSGLLDGGSAGDQREDDRGQGEPQREDEHSRTSSNAHRAERRQPGK